jgi:YggT family protein
MVPALDALIAFLRPALLGVAVVLAGVATVDWMVRTQRINPFGRIARLFRTAVDPLMLPIEKRVVRAGGLPANAPWWTLMALAIGGIVLLAALSLIRNQAATVVGSVNDGARGIYRLAVSWVVTLFQIAIVVRVVSSWIHFRPGAWYSRWSYRLSEPILHPIRRVVPLIGMVDISPIIGWFALSLVEMVLLSLW